MRMEAKGSFTKLDTRLNEHTELDTMPIHTLLTILSSGWPGNGGNTRILHCMKMVRTNHV